MTEPKTRIVTGTSAKRRWFRVVAGVPLLALAAVLGFVVWTVAHGHLIAVVDGDSMEPTVPRGSLAWIEPELARDIEVGDIVAIDTNRSDNNLVLHRVVSVVDQGNGLFFRTSGDANEAPDPTAVDSREIRGTLRAHVPVLGIPVDWASSIWAQATLAGLIALVFLTKSSRQTGATSRNSRPH